MENNLIIQDNKKPKSVKEAIENGWKTAKEIYEFAGVCRDTFNEFLSDVRRAMFQEPNSSCRIDPTTEKCITGAHNTKYYHPKVEEAFQLWLMRNQTNNNWYSVKEMCDICQVDRRTWVNFKAEFNCETNFPVKRNIRKGDKNVDYYPESILKEFQLWLKKNAMNAGGQRTEDSVIKQDNQQDLFIGCIVTKGTPEEIRSAAEYLKSVADQKEQLELANKAKQQLQLEIQQLEHALEYDQVKDWTPWNKLKKDWKNQFDMLRHKINYTELFKRAGLVENKDYKKKVMGLDNYPTVLVSPEAEDMLFDWLDSHN